MAVRRLVGLVMMTALVWPLASAPVPASAQSRTTWNLPSDYSGVQGGDDWYYYRGGPGGYQPLEYDTTVDPWPDRAEPSWNGGARFLEIAGPPEPYIQTGEGEDTAVGWKAPRSGTITVTGTMTATSTSTTYGAWCGPECDDGITFSILHGSDVEAGPERILHGDAADQAHTLTASFDVAAGDLVYFTQARGRWQDADAASHEFSVAYDGGGTGTSTPPGLTQVGSGIASLVQGGTSDHSLDGSSGLIKVWADAYTDIVDQWNAWNAINLDQSWIKVIDYRIVEATGVTGARYDADLTLRGRLAGIVDRIDYTLPVGGSATKYRVQLVVGAAETGSYSAIDSANGARAVVWEVENNLWEDLAWDVGEAVVGAAVGEWASSGVPSTWLAFALERALDINLTILPFAYDVIGADEETNGSFEATLKDLHFQAGKRYVLYAYLTGAVSAASTGIAAGTCELDFWHHSPHISDTAGSDPMGARGFRLTDFSVSFHPSDYDPPPTPTGPSPADGSVVDLSDRKDGTFPLRGVTLGWEDDRGPTYRPHWHVYFGDSFPLTDLGSADDPSMWTQRWAQPNTTYHWKLVAEGYGGRVTEGPLWSYRTTDFNHDPVVVQQWPDDAAVQPRRPTLTTRASDPNGHAMTYELFLGTTDPPTTIVSAGAVPSDGQLAVETDTLDADTTYRWFVRLRDGHDGQTDSAIRAFTTADRAPHIDLRHPADGASGTFAGDPLSVVVSDPDGDAVTVELFVGTSAGDLASRGQAVATSTLSGAPVSFTLPDLPRGALVYWRVVADDGNGGVTTEPVWYYRTRHNFAPTAPVVMGPVNGATGVALNPRLSWRSSTDNDGDALVYDLYLGDRGVLDIPLRASGLVTPWFDPGPLIANHTYTWKVVVRDGHGGQSETAAIWFTTGAP